MIGFIQNLCIITAKIDIYWCFSLCLKRELTGFIKICEFFLILSDPCNNNLLGFSSNVSKWSKNPQSLFGLSLWVDLRLLKISTWN